MDAEIALAVGQKIGAELKTLAPINPRNFVIAYREAGNGCGAVFNIFMHQLVVERNGLLVVIPSAKWFLTFSDLAVWNTVVGRYAALAQVQDVVADIGRYIKTTEPIDLN